MVRTKHSESMDTLRNVTFDVLFVLQQTVPLRQSLQYYVLYLRCSCQYVVCIYSVIHELVFICMLPNQLHVTVSYVFFLSVYVLIFHFLPIMYSFLSGPSHCLLQTLFITNIVYSLPKGCINHCFLFTMFSKRSSKVSESSPKARLIKLYITW